MNKFCVLVDIQDLSAYAAFGNYRLRGLVVAKDQISHFPIDLRRRPCNTLALPCECVIPTDVVPASDTCSRQEEIIHIQQWAKNNNLKLNTSKSKEMLFRARGVRGKSALLPPTCMGIERVATHTMLGVVVNDRLTATDHVNHLLSSAARLLYALRILRSHGTPTQSI